MTEYHTPVDASALALDLEGATDLEAALRVLARHLDDRDTHLADYLAAHDAPCIFTWYGAATGTLPPYPTATDESYSRLRFVANTAPSGGTFDFDIKVDGVTVESVSIPATTTDLTVTLANELSLSADSVVTLTVTAQHSTAGATVRFLD